MSTIDPGRVEAILLACLGGGWSFLNACEDRNGVLWTGLHRTVDHLLVLGTGLGLVSYVLPREMWSAFPGGMPYVLYTPAKAGL